MGSVEDIYAIERRFERRCSNLEGAVRDLTKRLSRVERSLVTSGLSAEGAPPVPSAVPWLRLQAVILAHDAQSIQIETERGRATLAPSEVRVLFRAPSGLAEIEIDPDVARRAGLA